MAKMIIFLLLKTQILLRMFFLKMYLVILYMYQKDDVNQQILQQ